MSKEKLKNINPEVSKRLSWTIFFVFVYMLGRAIPLATVPMNQEIFANGELKNTAELLSSLSGAQLSSLTLFSLGLGPYMTTMILWRALQLFRFPGMGKLTTKGLENGRLLLTILVACLQALGLTLNQNYYEYSILGFSSHALSVITTLVILVSGTLVVYWLGSMNAVKGIGGMTVLILPNLLLTFISLLRELLTPTTTPDLTYYVTVFLMLFLIFGLVMYTVTMYRAEYRIPIRRVILHNVYSKLAYIPLRLQPGGAMPYMYSMTLLSLQPLLINALLYFYPENSYLLHWSQNTSLQAPLGMFVYLALVYTLSIGFAYFNFDPQEKAKEMRYYGDYIEHIMPGKDTYIYLAKLFRRIAHLGAVMTCLTIGLPRLFLLGQSEASNLTLFFGSMFMATGLMLGIVDQVNQLQLWKKYRGILDY
ncbi:TPA: accessory Sec system protein translocase subunit SecY2 [Streptococcus agalactiae]